MDALGVGDAYELELSSELRLARDAILLVASGGARRVVIANLRHGRVIAVPAREFAAEVGVGLGTVPAEDPRRVDLVAMAGPELGIEAA